MKADRATAVLLQLLHGIESGLSLKNNSMSPGFSRALHNTDSVLTLKPWTFKNKKINLDVSNPVAMFAEELNIDICLGSDSGSLVITNSR